MNRICTFSNLANFPVIPSYLGMTGWQWRSLDPGRIVMRKDMDGGQQGRDISGLDYLTHVIGFSIHAH